MTPRQTGIAVVPVQLGHVLEVHAVDAGDQGGNGDERRIRGETLHGLVFLHRNHRQVHRSGRRDGVTVGFDDLVEPLQMVVDVAKILPQARDPGGNAGAGEVRYAFEQRRDGVLECHEALLQLIQRPDVGARVAVHGEDALLDFLQLVFELVEDREVAVDDRIHQGIEHIAGSLTEQLRLGFAPCAHVVKALFDAAAYGQDVVGAREDIDLSDPQVRHARLDHVQHGEQAVAVFLDLRPLVSLLRVFHRQGM